MQTWIAELLSNKKSSTDALVVLKMGGSMMDHAEDAIDQIVALHGQGYRFVLVHGGGPAINSCLRRMAIEPHFISGRRVTDEETLEVVRMVMLGQVNNELVRKITAHGGRAIGLNGIDGGLIHARRAPEALGLVGYVDSIDTEIIQHNLDAGFLPILAPLGVGPNGECLNINADDVATAVARALGAHHLILLSDVPGVLDQSGHTIPTLSEEDALELIDNGVISGGMIPKIESCLQALDRVSEIHIIDGKQRCHIGSILVQDSDAPQQGTHITKYTPHSMSI
jgi:acetylglutamate kinase